MKLNYLSKQLVAVPTDCLDTFVIRGRKLFLHQIDGDFVVSDFLTGLSAGSGKTRKLAMFRAVQKMDRVCSLTFEGFEIIN